MLGCLLTGALELTLESWLLQIFFPEKGMWDQSLKLFRPLVHHPSQAPNLMDIHTAEPRSSFPLSHRIGHLDFWSTKWEKGDPFIFWKRKEFLLVFCSHCKNLIFLPVCFSLCDSAWRFFHLVIHSIFKEYLLSLRLVWWAKPDGYLFFRHSCPKRGNR